jgi:hypothetical protein
VALVELAKYDNRMGAEIARGRLASEGIETILFDDGLASLGIGALTPVRLMVAEEEKAAAERLLAALG